MVHEAREQKTAENDLFSIDLMQVWTTLVYNQLTLVACVLLAISSSIIYLSIFRVDIFRTTVILKMSESAPSSALSAIMATLNSSETAATKIEALDDLVNSSEFVQILTERALKDKKFFKKFSIEAGFYREIPEQRLPAGDKWSIDEATREHLVEAMFSDLQFAFDGKRARLSVVGTNRSPVLSKQLAEMAGEAIMELNYKHKTTLISSLKKFLATQLEDINTRLKGFESMLVEKQKSDSPSIDGRNSAVLEYTEIEKDLLRVKGDLAINSDRAFALEKNRREFRAQMANPETLNSNDYLKQLQARMRTLAYELEATRSTGPADESIANIRSELERTRTSYFTVLEKLDASTGAGTGPTEYFQNLSKQQKTLHEERQILLGRLERDNKALGNLKQKTALVPDLMRDLGSIQRNIAINSKLYTDTEVKLQEVRFMEAETVNDLTIHSVGSVPSTPSNISVTRVLVTAPLLGLLFGILTIFLFGLLDQRVRSTTDVKRACDQFLGRISEIESELMPAAILDLKGSLKSLHGELVRRPIGPVLVLNNNPDSIDADNFRLLRMNLLSMIENDVELAQRKCKVIMVASPGVKSGGTFLAANVAHSLAKADFKTLIVALDLRSPGMQKYFSGFSAALTQNLTEGADLKESIQKFSPHLDLLLMDGKAEHPPEFLESERLKHLFADLRASYDFIIFDTAAIHSAVDPVISSGMSDLVLMTIDARKTTRVELTDAVRKLRICNKMPIYGIVNFAGRRWDSAA